MQGLLKLNVGFGKFLFYFIILKKYCRQDKDVVKLKVEVLAEKVCGLSVAIFARVKIRKMNIYE